MIATLTLNPCIDKTITVNGFNYGGLNRVVKTRSDASGKGINVSIAVRQLGGTTECFGFNFAKGGDIVSERLDRNGITYRFIDNEGVLRTNIKIFDEQTGTMTELNETGHEVTAEAIALLEKIIMEHAKEAQIMVFNGSVPKGVPKDIYKTLIAKVNKKGVTTVLDADGELFLEGLKAKPYFIKPNLYEFETAFQVKIKSRQELVGMARELITEGVQVVCVSLGKEGAVIINSDEAWFSAGASIEVKGVQGAGDSLVAGICLALEQKLELSEMLRYGVAAANASLIREGTLLCTANDFQKMLPLVTVERII